MCERIQAEGMKGEQCCVKGAEHVRFRMGGTKDEIRKCGKAQKDIRVIRIQA